ncbi:ABC transporter substrate-binding protein [Moorella sulfitireducens (nom. illeg.)]|uniref:ABC transporter substrate-binding protein n=1 Tax=Neomoorella sulfitireducens TaxID=2972948 RepID=UPI0021ABB0AC|nr:ABC transporter substrate-binding protein [Moorella sulfitireducens]
MRKKWILAVLTILLVVVLVTASGCGQKSSESQDASKKISQSQGAGKDTNVIKIGAIYPLSGPTAQDGENQRKAHELAVEEINKAGGIKSLGGAKLQFVYADSQSKPEVGIAEAERLINQEKVVALMGTYESHVAMSVSEIAERYGIPIIIPNALADKLTERGLKYTFKTVIKTSDFGRDTGKFVREIGEKTGKVAKRAAILYGDFFFGHEVAEGWIKQLPQMGFEIVANVAYPVPATNMQEALLKVKQANPDVLFVLGNISEAVLTIKQLKELNYWPTYGVVGVGGGFSNPVFLQNTGQLAEGLFIANDWFPEINRAGSKEVNKKFKDKYGIDMTGNANTTYAATWVLADALERAGSTDGNKLREALANTDITSGPATFMYDRIKFDETGQNISAQNVIAQVQGGKPMVVWPDKYKIADPKWPVPGWDKR